MKISPYSVTVINLAMPPATPSSLSSCTCLTSMTPKCSGFKARKRVWTRSRRRWYVLHGAHGEDLGVWRPGRKVAAARRQGYPDNPRPEQAQRQQRHDDDDGEGAGRPRGTTFCYWQAEWVRPWAMPRVWPLSMVLRLIACGYKLAMSPASAACSPLSGGSDDAPAPHAGRPWSSAFAGSRAIVR